MISTKGILEFDPQDRTKKHKFQSSWKRVALIKTNCELDLYYAWFVKKRFNLDLNRSLRGSHVTIISDRMDKSEFDKVSKLFNGKEIEFFINLSPMSSGKHWWMNVKCPDAESIRELAGLSRKPYFDFHLTIGYANEKNEMHSEYIWRQMDKFSLA